MIKTTKHLSRKFQDDLKVKFEAVLCESFKNRKPLPKNLVNVPKDG